MVLLGTVSYKRIIECYIEFAKEYCNSTLLIEYKAEEWQIMYSYNGKTKHMFLSCLSEAYWVTKCLTVN